MSAAENRTSAVPSEWIEAGLKLVSTPSSDPSLSSAGDFSFAATESAVRASVTPTESVIRSSVALDAALSFSSIAEIQARTASMAPHRFHLRAQWEGVVLQRTGDSFVASLRDFAAEDELEDAELFVDDVAEEDRSLIEPGAIFYWSIGYEDTSRGRERKSLIQFRRLPGWSARDLAAVAEKKKSLAAIFQLNSRT